MPRNVRNFWIETRADGVENQVATGPKAHDGGFRTQIYMRDNGSVKDAVRIDGWAGTDGKLILEISSDMPWTEAGDGCIQIVRHRDKETIVEPQEVAHA